MAMGCNILIETLLYKIILNTNLNVAKNKTNDEFHRLSYFLSNGCKPDSQL